jgi:hypothetical protein
VLWPSILHPSGDAPRTARPIFRFNRDFYDLDERGHPVGCRNLDQLHARIKQHMLRRRDSARLKSIPRIESANCDPPGCPGGAGGSRHSSPPRFYGFRFAPPFKRSKRLGRPGTKSPLGSPRQRSRSRGASRRSGAGKHALIGSSESVGHS